MTSYRFDLYPRTDPRDGTLIRSFTSLQKAAYRAEANGTSTGQIAVRSTTDDGQAIDPLGLQYVRVVELPGGSVRGGFFLEKGKFQALSEDEDSLLTFSGAGTLAYLARAAMAPHTYLDIAIGTDPYDDTWRWGDQGPAAGGDYIGAALWRVIYEAQHFRVALTEHRHADGEIYTDSHDDDRTESAIPDVVMTFDQFEDSSGNPWTIASGDLKSQVGESVLSVVKRLMEAGLYVELDPDTFELNAWEQDVHRAMLDATGSAWAANVVRFQAPTDPDDISTGNIKDDAVRNIEAHIKRSALWAGGSDVYGLSTSPSDIPWEGYYRADIDDSEALEAIAAVQLDAIAEAGDTLKLQLWMDDDPANGRYLPFDHVKLDQQVTVHTGTDQWEFDERTFPVAAITIELRQGGNWQAIVELGASYSVTASRQFQVRGTGGHTHPPNPELCRPIRVISVEASCATDTASMIPVSAPNADFETGLTTNWTMNQVSGGVVSNGSTPQGTYHYQLNGGGYAYYTFPASVSFVAGNIYVGRLRLMNMGMSTAFRLGRDFLTGSGDVGVNSSVQNSGNDTWEDFCVEWIPDSTYTGDQVGMLIGKTSGSDSWEMDDLRVYSGGTSVGSGDGHADLIGHAKRASRCDHRHDVHRDTAPTVNDDEADGYKLGTIWAQLDDLDTPTEIVAVWMLADAAEGAAVWLEWPSGVLLSDDTPLVESGSGSAGTSDEASRSDHVHPADGGGGGGGGWDLVVDDSGASAAGFSVQAGTWSSDGASYGNTVNPGAAYARSRYNTIVPFGRGFVAQVEIQFPTASQGTGANVQGGLIVGHAGDTSTGALAVILDTGSAQRIEVSRQGAAAITTYSTTIGKDTWYTLRMVVSGSYVSTYLNGTLMGTALFHSVVAPLNANYLQLMSYNALTRFRNLKAWFVTLP